MIRMSLYEEQDKLSVSNLAADFFPLAATFGSPMTALATGQIMRNDNSMFEGLNDDNQEDRSNRFSF
jgi:hypothetical protein